MKEYEAMAIIDSNLEDEKIAAVVTKVQGIIKKNGGSVEKVDEWGKRKMAYPIQKQATGYYAVFYFKAPEDSIKEMNRVLRISDDLLRHMIFRKGE